MGKEEDIMKNIYTFKVTFGDTDAAGIVFYPNFYRWMDQATHDFFGNMIMPISKLMREEEVVNPLLEAFCQFKSPLKYEDTVEVHSEVIEVKNKVFKIEHLFKKDEETVASGYEVRAWVSTANDGFKAVSIPDQIREKMDK